MRVALLVVVHLVADDLAGEEGVDSRGPGGSESSSDVAFSLAVFDRANIPEHSRIDQDIVPVLGKLRFERPASDAAIRLFAIEVQDDQLVDPLNLLCCRPPDKQLRVRCAAAQECSKKQSEEGCAHRLTGLRDVLETAGRSKGSRTLEESDFPCHNAGMEKFHATTILTVRHGGKVAIGGDGQVTLGTAIMKADAMKIRRLKEGSVLCGFAGSSADAFALLERFEAKLKDFPGNVPRAATELAKEWRTDRALRRLEALMIVADAKNLSLIHI